MTLLWVLLAAAVSLGVVFALIRSSLFWFQRQAGRQFEQKFQDAHQILQTRRPPALWTQSERMQIEKLRSQSKDVTMIARTGERGKRRCLHQLLVLTRFLENGRFYDSLETREQLVEKLEEIHEQWLNDPWERLLDLHNQDADGAG